MKFAPFEYHRPDTVEETVELLADYGDDCKILAGGQSLLPVMALRLSQPSHLVDIGRVSELNRVELQGNTLVVGAGTRHRTVETHPFVAAHLPLLSATLAYVGHVAIRNRGTVGGSIAHADPAAELPALALALHAEMVAASSRGERTIPAAEFFTTYLSTVLEPDELLVEVRLPIPDDTTRWAVDEVSRRHGDFALCGLVATASAGTGWSLSFFGVGSTPVRARQAERALASLSGSDTAGDEVARLVMEELDPPDDVHATAGYRRHVAGELTRRCLARIRGEERMRG